MRNMVRILYGEADAKVATEQAEMFAGPQYQVEHAIGRKAIEEALTHGPFALVVLGHTLTKDDRHHLPYMVKRIDPHTRVLVLHASGKHPKVDLALDSRRGEAVVREAIAELLLEPVAVA
jgi:DNA-binding NtrC family response regulator